MAPVGRILQWMLVVVLLIWGILELVVGMRPLDSKPAWIYRFRGAAVLVAGFALMTRIAVIDGRAQRQAKLKEKAGCP